MHSSPYTYPRKEKEVAAPSASEKTSILHTKKGEDAAVIPGHFCFLMLDIVLFE